MSLESIVSFVADFFDFSSYEDIKMKLALIIGFVIGIIIIIIFFVLIKKRKERRRKEIKEEKENPYTLRIRKIKKIKDSKKALSGLGSLFRGYLREHHMDISHEAGYGEIAEILKKKEKKKLAGFCEALSYYRYSGEDVTKQDISKLIERFEDITKGN